MSVCRRVGAVVTCSYRLGGPSQAVGVTIVRQATRIPTTLNGLAQDPTMRIIVGRRGGPERPAASTNTMSRFETEVLTQDGNVEGLGRLNAKWVDGAISRTPHRRVILDMDSSESPVHGEQEGASYNGSLWEHVLSPFVRVQPVRGLRGRPSCVRGTYIMRTRVAWMSWIHILSRYGVTGVRRYFRADAAFAKPDIYEYLEERRVFIRNTAAEQQGPAIRVRSTADTTCGEAADASSDPIRRLLVSCRELGPRSACGGQGGVA